MAKFIIFITEIVFVSAACVGIFAAFGISAFAGSLFSLICGVGLVMSAVEGGHMDVIDYYNMNIPIKGTLMNIIANLLFANVAIVYDNHYWLLEFFIGWAIGYIARMGFYFLARLAYRHLS